MELYLVVEAAGARRREVDDVARALDEAGLRTVLAGAADVPVDAVRLVWAEDLSALLAGIDRADRGRWLDCAVVVNPQRGRVLDLLEESGVLGALEYGEPADLRDDAAEPARVFVRKDVVRHRGERMGGEVSGAESDDYTLWTDPDAASPAEDLARYVAIWRESDAELCVGAEEARERRLPPVELRLRLGGTGLVRIPAVQAPGYYLVLGSAPGGGAGFFARPSLEDPAGEGLEQIARRMLQNPSGPPLQAAGGIEWIRLAGAERESICLFSDWFHFRTASCAVRIEHAGGALMAIFACPMGTRPPSCQAVLADPALRRIAGSLQVSNAMEVRSSSGTPRSSAAEPASLPSFARPA